MKYDNEKAQPYKSVELWREHGRICLQLECPFCGCKFNGFIWSICGSGKKCPQCGALHTSSKATPIMGSTINKQRGILPMKMIMKLGYNRYCIDVAPADAGTLLNCIKDAKEFGGFPEEVNPIPLDVGLSVFIEKQPEEES